jgi:hypothetical protein
MFKSSTIEVKPNHLCIASNSIRMNDNDEKKSGLRRSYFYYKADLSLNSQKSRRKLVETQRFEIIGDFMNASHYDLE